MLRFIVGLFYFLIILGSMHIGANFYIKGLMGPAVLMLIVTVGLSMASVSTMSTLDRIAARQKQRKEKQS